jgi:hypothetical protein
VSSNLLFGVYSTLLGGLVGDDIFLVLERVNRLTSRIHK